MPKPKKDPKKRAKRAEKPEKAPETKKKGAAAAATMPPSDAAIAIRIVDHTPVDEMYALAKKATASLTYTRELFPKLLTLTEDERRTSSGKLRDDEEKALRAVLEVIKRHPQYFTALADRDFGDDPNVFECQLLLDRLDRRAALVEVANALAKLLGEFNDTILRVGELVRQPVLEAYQIAKPIAQRDPQVRTLLAPALDFYGQLGKKAQKTKEAKAKAAKAAGSSGSSK